MGCDKKILWPSVGLQSGLIGTGWSSLALLGKKIHRQDLTEEVRAKNSLKCETISISGTELRVTPVFYAYWRFAAERQRIFYRRLHCADHLTDDPVLQNFKFTNAYRASDRVSQYLIRNVIYRDDLPSDETNLFFRILLFKLFNKIETWKFLEDEIGPLTWDTFSFDHYNTLLSRRMSSGYRIYSAAYIMPSGGSFFGHNIKHQNHLRMVELLIHQGYPSRFVDSKRMANAFALLRSVPSIGPFLAYQYVTDLNTNGKTEEHSVPSAGSDRRRYPMFTTTRRSR